MNIVLSFDHAGYVYAHSLTHFLESNGYHVINTGPQKIDENDDFPDYASQACQMILSGEADRGVLICGTGIGMSVAANRHRGIRAVLAYNSEIAKIARTHNDANIICFGGRTMTLENILESLQIFLITDFLGGKYQRRNEKLDVSSEML